MYSSILMPQSLLAESHHLGVQDLQLQQLGEAVQDVMGISFLLLIMMMIGILPSGNSSERARN